MTRRDYVLIAECIDAAQKHNPWPSLAEKHAALLMQRTIVNNLAAALQHANPAGFDRDRFVVACGGNPFQE